MDSLAAGLARSPELFPLDLNPTTDEVTLIRLREADYRQSSFLDARILTPVTPRRAMPWAALDAAVAAAGLEETAGYIFQIGHVGSTLLSRLLGAHPHVFALREPAILRTLVQIRCVSGALSRWSDEDLDRRLGTILKLLSRTFRPEQFPIVKTTSFVSELAAQILARPKRPKAIFMFVPAETYLATILGAPNSPKEIRLLAASRLKRLHRHIRGEHWHLSELSEGELVVMSWVCEMTALSAAGAPAEQQVLWLNFNTFLESPATSLLSAFQHLGVRATPSEIDLIMLGPELRRYAKAPEDAYGPELRSQVLNRTRKDHAAEIARGLAWLKHAATESKAIEFVSGLR